MACVGWALWVVLFVICLLLVLVWFGLVFCRLVFGCYRSICGFVILWCSTVECGVGLVC